MKKILLLISALTWMLSVGYAQQFQASLNELPVININKDVSLHFLSPELIQYVDISTHTVVGDLPLKNMLRVKLMADSNRAVIIPGKSLAIVTVVGESFIAQYNLCYNPLRTNEISLIDIIPKHTRPLEVPGITLSSVDMQAFAKKILKQRDVSTLYKSTAFGMQTRLNRIYTLGDYIFLDLNYWNKSNISYEIDEQRFKIEDRKITKATNIQSVEIRPVWQLYSPTSFKGRYRNIYVFKKFTYPGNKVLNIELTEKQISGRVLSIRIPYKDILQADTL